MSDWRLMIVVMVLVLSANHRVAHAEERLQIVPIVSGDEVVVSFELSDAYTEDLRAAISSGLLTRFTYEIELRMSVAGWVDRTIETVVITTTNRFDNLTRSHKLTRVVNGREIDSLVTADEAAVRQWLTTVKRLPLCPTSKLDPSRDYTVRINARRSPFSSSLLGWANNIVGMARFTFVP
jgi:hypothetical protein